MARCRSRRVVLIHSGCVCVWVYVWVLVCEPLVEKPHNAVGMHRAAWRRWVRMCVLAAASAYEAKKSISWGVSLSAVQEAQWCARGCDDAHRRAHSWHSEMPHESESCDRANLSVRRGVPCRVWLPHDYVSFVARRARWKSNEFRPMGELRKSCCPSAPVRIRRAYYLFVFAGRGVVSGV